MDDLHIINLLIISSITLGDIIIFYSSVLVVVNFKAYAGIFYFVYVKLCFIREYVKTTYDNNCNQKNCNNKKYAR